MGTTSTWRRVGRTGSISPCFGQVPPSQFMRSFIGRRADSARPDTATHELMKRVRLLAMPGVCCLAPLHRLLIPRSAISSSMSSACCGARPSRAFEREIWTRSRLETAKAKVTRVAQSSPTAAFRYFRRPSNCSAAVPEADLPPHHPWRSRRPDETEKACWFRVFLLYWTRNSAH